MLLGLLLHTALLHQAEAAPQQSIQLAHEAAAKGDFKAMVSLYEAYRFGQGVVANQVEAMKWLRKAAEGGSAHAQCLLGYRYENPDWERSPADNRLPPPNMPEAVQWYQRSANQNWAGGQYHLGLCYLDGTGVEQDEERGLELIRKAADQNQVFAMVELANLYAKGVGSPRGEADRPIAILKRVATCNCDPEENQSKFVEAYEGLILRYEHGVGVERDPLTAVEWQCRAALAGMGNYSLAEPKPRGTPNRDDLGSFTGEPGRGIIAVTIPDSSGRTAAFYRLLGLYLRASRGNGPAAAQIGDACLTGLEVPANHINAWMWFTVAARAGAGKDSLARCEAAMTPDEIKQARLHLQEFTQHLNEVGRRAQSENR